MGSGFCGNIEKYALFVIWMSGCIEACYCKWRAGDIPVGRYDAEMSADQQTAAGSQDASVNSMSCFCCLLTESSELSLFQIPCATFGVLLTCC